MDDRDDIFNTLSYNIDRPPTQPNTMTFSVNPTGTHVTLRIDILSWLLVILNRFCPVVRYYGIKLATHYITIPSKEAGKPRPGGKIAVTSSGAGLFPIPAIPQYTASKHALVGLVRVLARTKAALEANVRINTVCPAIVATGSLQPGLLGKLPPDQITPMSTILRCFDTLADLGHVENEDWVEQRRTGETVEGNVQDLIWYNPPEQPQGKGGKFERQNGALVVAEAYKESKRQFAMEGEQSTLDKYYCLKLGLRPRFRLKVNRRKSLV
jgi:NAD(P)-dependent dehydrogenase (short-subunit alcohol dehydrogenase family)